MAGSVSIRRSLRRIPAFRSLPAQRLETMIDRMICKEYRSGEVIWRTSGQTNFLAVIQSGEILLEYRIYGSVIRSTRLLAGDYLLPRNLKNRNQHSVILARAVTDTTLHILPIKQADTLQTLIAHGKSAVSEPGIGQHILWNSVWLAMVAILILLLTWTDLTRIASGVLYMAATNTEQATAGEPGSIPLLEYAQAIDHKADFAYNQEGYIWYRQNDLPQAEAAFMQALNADHANGAALNNQAVTYFKAGLLPQATIYQQQAAESDPDNAVVQYNLGIVRMADRSQLDAIGEFKEASFIQPTWVLPYVQQGFLYLQTGDFLNAEQAARHAIQMDPTQESVHLILAIALHNQGRQQEARKAVEQALQMSPEDRVARFYQARILMNLGEFNNAQKILSQLLASATDAGEAARIDAEMEAWHRYLQHIPLGIP